MRAVVAREPGGPEVLRVEEVALPELGPGEALIRVAYASFNPLDAHARAARVEYKASAFPYTPGYEYAGRVEAVGAGGDAGLVGRRVSFVGHPGGCAEYVLAPLGSPLTRIFEIPAGFDWQLGTVFAVCAYSAWHILHTAARLRAGETVLFHGAAGSIGTMGTQIAKEAGATVLGLCGGPEKVAWAGRFGADHLIDHTAADWVEQTLRLTGGRGVDLIVDGVAGPAAPRNFGALAPFGQVVYIGRIGGSAPAVDISRELYAKSIAVRAFLLYVAMAQTGGRELPAIHEALGSGRWVIPVGRVWELDQVAELHRRFEQRSLLGKQLIRVGGDL